MKATPLDVIKQLDGLSIQEATHILEEAMRLLIRTQLVSAQSPLLLELETKEQSWRAENSKTP